MECFHEGDSPLEAIIGLGRDNLSWLVSKIMCAPDGSGRPLVLLPFQSVLLELLWNKKFPMMLLPRGGGKCLRNSLVYNDLGCLYLEELLEKNMEGIRQYKTLNMLGENGYNKTDYGWDNGESKTKIVRTKFGYEIEGTLNHPVRVWTSSGMVWKNLEDICPGDRIPIYRKSCEFGQYRDISEEMGYVIGALIGDGTMTQRNNIRLTNIDPDIINQYCDFIDYEIGYKVKHYRDNVEHCIHNVKFYDWLMSPEVGCKPVTAHHKDVPIGIRRSSKSVVAAFLRGLFDTDGTVGKNRRVQLSSVSKRLIQEVQTILLAFGIISRTKKRLVKYLDGRNESWELTIDGNNVDIFYKEIGFTSCKKQTVLKKIINKVRNPNSDTIPFINEKLVEVREECKSISGFDVNGRHPDKRLIEQCRLRSHDVSYKTLGRILDICKNVSYLSIYKELEEIYENNYFYDTVESVDNGYGRCFDIHVPEDHSFISNGFVSHNSFIMGVYAILACLLHPGEEIIITGKAFRQSKKVFEYMERLLNTSPILSEAVNTGFKKYHRKKKDAISHGSDRHEFHIGLSKTIALPIGDGESIRGQRACVDPNTIIETDIGLMRIIDTFDKTGQFRLYTGEGNNLELPEQYIKTNPIDAYRIRTMGNYEFTCSDIHKVYTKHGFKYAKDLTDDDSLVFENHYSFPSKYISHDNVVMDEDLSWAIGLMVAEGSLSDRCSVSVKMTEKEPLDRLQSILEKYNLNVCRYIREAYQDARFNCLCKKSYELQICNKRFRTILHKLGIDFNKARFKKVPFSILSSPKSVVLSFLSGLFHGDGSAFLYKDKNRHNNFGISYYTSSEQLSIDIQTILAKLDIFSTRGFRESRLSSNLQYHIRLYGRSPFDLYNLIDVPKWRPTYEQSYKGGRFIAKRNNLKVKSVEKLDGKRVLYDYTVPISQSFMGNCFRQHNTRLLADEFASINEEIFEIVIAPFLSVGKNPQQSVELYEFLDRLEGLGANDKVIHRILEQEAGGNQITIAGTASHRFNHFYRYFGHYKEIIDSAGDPGVLRRAIARKSNISMEQVADIDIIGLVRSWKEYCIYQVPYQSLPKGFMDEGIISRNRLTFSAARFQQEYECHFPDETGGFIPYSLIQQAMPVGSEAIEISLFGEPGARYVMGIDPARQQDYFAIVIAKLTGAGTYELKYCRAWQKREYSVIIPYILELCRRFNIVKILMDAGGGGVHVRDSMCDPNQVPNKSEIIWDEDDDKSQFKTWGRHILKLQNFSNAWVDEAINSMKSDIEHKRFKFPTPNSAHSEETLMKQYARRQGERPEQIFKKRGDDWDQKSFEIIQAMTDELFGVETEDGDKIYDGVLDDINEAIAEICAIERQGIPGSANVKYDLPKITAKDALDIRHRDRYTATLLASYAARMVMSSDVHEQNQLPSNMGGITPQTLNRKGPQRRKIRKSHEGTSMRVDYGDWYKNQQDDK